MKHETKNEDHQTKEDEVANLWCTWMSEIPTKLEKIGSTSSLTWHGEEEEARALSVCSGSGSGRKAWPIYSRPISTGWWLQPVQNVEVSAGWSHQQVLKKFGAI